MQVTSEKKGGILSTDVLANVAWLVLTSSLGLALPLGIGVMVGPGIRRDGGRLLVVALVAFLVSLGCGFSLQYGFIHVPQLGESTHSAWQWAPFGYGSGLLAWSGPGLPRGVEMGRMALFVLQAVGGMVVVVLAVAPLYKRLPGPGILAVAVFAGGILYPLLGHWVWGGGWLAATGRTAYLGHGFVDFAGVGVYYTLGGSLAMAGLLATKGRKTPLDSDVSLGEDAAIRPQQGRGLTLFGGVVALLGMTALHLASGWGVLPRMGLVVVNTWTGAAAAGIVAAVYMAFTTTRLRTDMLVRGLLAGAAASAGVAPFAAPTTLLIVGAGAGLLTCLGSYWIERFLRLDDIAGIVPGFGVGGLWGILAVGLFSDGTFGQGLNGVAGELYLGVAGQGVSGIALLAPGMTPDFGQLAAQVLGMGVILVWGLGVGWLLFRLGNLRPRREERPVERS